jgi:hypothetical protein
MTLILDVADAKQLVSGNRRIHHMVRAKVCAHWRRAAHDLAIAEYGWADVGCTWHQRARIVITVRFPDLRRRDVSNLYPYVAKPLMDGLIDARVLPDDDDRHVIGPDLRRDPDRGPHRICIDIEDLGAPQ